MFSKLNQIFLDSKQVVKSVERYSVVRERDFEAKHSAFEPRSENLGPKELFHGIKTYFDGKQYTFWARSADSESK